MRLTTPSCRLGGTILARMKRWPLSGSTVGCVIGLPAFGDGPVWCRKRSRWSMPPSRCLPPTTLMEQRQNSPCHCLLNTLKSRAFQLGDFQGRKKGTRQSRRVQDAAPCPAAGQHATTAQGGDNADGSAASSFQRAAGTDTARCRFNSGGNYAGALWRADTGLLAADRQHSGTAAESGAQGGTSSRRTGPGSSPATFDGSGRGEGDTVYSARIHA